MKARAVALAFLALGLASAARAGETEDRALFQGRYAAMKAAMASRDGVGIRALLAPGFVSVDSRGEVENADRMVAEVLALPPDPNKKTRTAIQSVRLNGASAEVVQRYDMKTIKPGEGGAVRHVELVTVSTDTWLMSAGAWRLAKTVTDRLDYFVDGTLAAHQGR